MPNTLSYAKVMLSGVHLGTETISIWLRFLCPAQTEPIVHFDPKYANAQELRLRGTLAHRTWAGKGLSGEPAPSTQVHGFAGRQGSCRHALRFMKP